MQIREATHNDIPQILKVLKASLGETSSKKTEEVWRYKHIDNPFGESLVLVAEEEFEIIGVRAFMRWRWQKGDFIFSAFRAVDTATHPAHQGKGIFKRLTLQALEIAKERGDHFVFNTPNDQSKPGYLKMGWEEVSKLKIQLRPLNLLIKSNKNIEDTTTDQVVVEKLLDFYSKDLRATGRLFTPKHMKYIRWRYLDNPMLKYVSIFEKDYFIIGYLKNRGRFKEFRVAETFSTETGKARAKIAILNLANRSGANVLSISPDAGIKFKASLKGKFGPVLTYKSINNPQSDLLNLNTWLYSLGDLELF